MKGVDYGITVGIVLKNSGAEWPDLVLVAYLHTLGFNILLVNIGVITRRY